jgi:hypothetical protein
VARRTLGATQSDLRQQVVDQLVKTRRHDSARPLASTSTKGKEGTALGHGKGVALVVRTRAQLVG